MFAGEKIKQNLTKRVTTLTIPYCAGVLYEEKINTHSEK